MSPLHRIHRMPFGAQLEKQGTRFRLWAPSARSVGLFLDGDEMPMPAGEDGWYSLDVPGAGPGSRYQFRIDGGLLVPDPASRSNPDDVHGPSELVDPESFAWEDGGWRGRAWEEAVIYELHVGTFSPEGSFAGVAARLDYLLDLGVTAIELMPVADFPGRRNWGYDGVLQFAPDSRYGRPNDLKRLVQGAHARGMMVLLDVVYNHFGPEGNYLHLYAAQFFDTQRHTPWGAAIDFDGPHSRTVRDFFIHNALFWLEEYNLDGLRLDAIHTIDDRSTPDLVAELADVVRRGPGRTRELHLVLENDRNQTRYLARGASGAPLRATAQWNDDVHHALHVLLTGERDGYYLDYSDDNGSSALRHLGRCLAEGFAFQGEASRYRHGAHRGEPSRHLPPTAFVTFLQNHDQVGNRAFGERIDRLADPQAIAAAMAIVLLAPSPPLLFMGEEFAAAQPFTYFCDFGPDLAEAVSAGRRREFAAFARFAELSSLVEELPEPGADSTFAACVLDWEATAAPPHSDWLAFTRTLLALRRRHIVPRLVGVPSARTLCRLPGGRVLHVEWRLGDGSLLTLLANLGAQPASGPETLPGSVLYLSANLQAGDPETRGSFLSLAPWSVAWLIDPVPLGGAP